MQGQVRPIQDLKAHTLGGEMHERGRLDLKDEWLSWLLNLIALTFAGT